MQITNVKCPEDKYSIKCPYEMIPEGITVHNTYNDASAMAEISYMLGNSLKTSFHVAVDNERVVTGIPFNRNSWNSGDGRNGFGNRKTISIEICYSKSGGEKFDEAEELCAEYIAYLLKQYNWGIDKVGTHQMRSGKYCPHRTLDLGWERFLDKIKYYMNYQNNPVDNSNIEKGSDEKVRTYANGSTRENIYSDTDCKNKIGSLDPWEKCDCFGEFNKRAMVRYHVNGTNNYKIGFAKWLGGIK
jgi:N-acetylmuramoyl-L-alanine amidase CwlA